MGKMEGKMGEQLEDQKGQAMDRSFEEDPFIGLHSLHYLMTPKHQINICTLFLSFLCGEVRL